MTWQDPLVLFFVALCAAYAGRAAWRAFARGDEGAGCGCGKACAAKTGEQEPVLISLGPPLQPPASP